MSFARPNDGPADIHARLSGRGLRLTAQRQGVYQVLLGRRDHPTAEDVFLRAKRRMPDISLATVYNCLDALVRCGLARQVNVDPAARRYCPNMAEHGHFYCERCGSVFDVRWDTAAAQAGVVLPEGFQASGLEFWVRGMCAECAQVGVRIEVKAT